MLSLFPFVPTHLLRRFSAVTVGTPYHATTDFLGNITQTPVSPNQEGHGTALLANVVKVKTSGPAFLYFILAGFFRRRSAEIRICGPRLITKPKMASHHSISELSARFIFQASETCQSPHETDFQITCLRPAR